MDGWKIELGFALRRSEWRSARAFRIRDAVDEVRGDGAGLCDGPGGDGFVDVAHGADGLALVDDVARCEQRGTGPCWYPSVRGE